MTTIRMMSRTAVVTIVVTDMPEIPEESFFTAALVPVLLPAFAFALAPSLLLLFPFPNEPKLLLLALFACSFLADELLLLIFDVSINESPCAVSTYQICLLYSSLHIFSSVSHCKKKHCFCFCNILRKFRSRRMPHFSLHHHTFHVSTPPQEHSPTPSHLRSSPDFCPPDTH